MGDIYAFHMGTGRARKSGGVWRFLGPADGELLAGDLKDELMPPGSGIGPRLWQHGQAIGVMTAGSTNCTVNGNPVVREGDVGQHLPKYLVHGNYVYAIGIKRGLRWPDKFDMFEPTARQPDRVIDYEAQTFPRVTVNGQRVMTVSHKDHIDEGRELGSVPADTVRGFTDIGSGFYKWHNYRVINKLHWIWWWFHIALKGLTFNQGWGYGFMQSCSTNATFGTDGEAAMAYPRPNANVPEFRTPPLKWQGRHWVENLMSAARTLLVRYGLDG